MVFTAVQDFLIFELSFARFAFSSFAACCSGVSSFGIRFLSPCPQLLVPDQHPRRARGPRTEPPAFSWYPPKAKAALESVTPLLAANEIVCFCDAAVPSVRCLRATASALRGHRGGRCQCGQVSFRLSFILPCGHALACAFLLPVFASRNPALSESKQHSFASPLSPNCRLSFPRNLSFIEPKHFAFNFPVTAAALLSLIFNSLPCVTCDMHGVTLFASNFLEHCKDHHRDPLLLD